jgi:hypothetical protein
VRGNSERLSYSSEIINSSLAWTVTGWWWFNKADNVDYGKLIIFEDAVAGIALTVELLVTDPDVNCYLYDSVAGGSAATLHSTNGIVDQAWNFITVNYDPSDLKLRAQANTGTEIVGGALSNGPRDFDSVGIGARPAGGNPLTCLSDEVAIYNRLLSADERAALYAAGAGRFYDFQV